MEDAQESHAAIDTDTAPLSEEAIRRGCDSKFASDKSWENGKGIVNDNIQMCGLPSCIQSLSETVMKRKDYREYRTKLKKGKEGEGKEDTIQASHACRDQK